MALDRRAIVAGQIRVWLAELTAWFRTIASAAIYATLIVTFGGQIARVEGRSMAPTLEDQDRLVINKFAYIVGEPLIGDIVMLRYTLDPDKTFVKRIIAKEGDVVQIVEGHVTVNGTPLPDFVPAEYVFDEDLGPETVPQGYYYVMGDHRARSSDSRSWGGVPKKYIVGKVQLRWWPVPNARIF